MGGANVGDRVKVSGEVQRYTIQARDDRFVIMTKPFNARKTYLYCIADLKEKVRGPSNFIFGPLKPFDTPDGAQENLAMLQTGKQGISRRKSLPLSDEEVGRLRAEPATSERPRSA